jgi:hypothetical protein
VPAIHVWAAGVHRASMPERLLELVDKLECDTQGRSVSPVNTAQRFFGSGWKMITSALASSPMLRPRWGIDESM